MTLFSNSLKQQPVPLKGFFFFLKLLKATQATCGFFSTLGQPTRLHSQSIGTAPWCMLWRGSADADLAQCTA
jgi:hypothetical protein